MSRIQKFILPFCIIIFGIKLYSTVLCGWKTLMGLEHFPLLIIALVCFACEILPHIPGCKELVWLFIYLFISVPCYRQCLHFTQQQQQPLRKVHPAPAEQVRLVTRSAYFHCFCLVLFHTIMSNRATGRC